MIRTTLQATDMTKRFESFVVVAAFGLGLLLSTDAAAGRKGPEVGTHGQPAEVRERAMQALYARLAAASHAAERHVVTLTGDDLRILANPSVDSTGRLRVGVHRAVGRSVTNGRSDLIVAVPGAPAIRLELARVEGTVAVFNDAGQAHEYSEDGFTHTFVGDEVRVRGNAHVTGTGAVNLGGNLCDFNASCTENAECVSIPAAIETARDAHASCLFISGPSYYVCSGGLIADSDPGTEVPYLLTANHCISKAREARSLETFFQYVQSSCNAGPCTLPGNASTIGSTIVATNQIGDYSLLQLSENPPAGSVFLGWNDSPVAFSSGIDLYRISHPGGAPQAYSEHVVDASAPTCGSWPRGERIYSRDTFGATEGGSSGSPVLNSNAEVVGQLSGVCGENVNDECDSVRNATVDGAFAAYYPEVQPFLGDGSAECTVDGDCGDGDPCTTDTCEAGVCSNVLIDCTDGDGCTADSCDPSTGACKNVALSCDDGNACTTDSCDSTIGCVNDSVVCPDDGDPCTAEACDSATGQCQSNLVDCDDGLFCTGVEACVEGSCVVGFAPCVPGNQCASTCDEDADTCSDPPGTSCEDDANPCTVTSATEQEPVCTCQTWQHAMTRSSAMAVTCVRAGHAQSTRDLRVPRTSSASKSR